MVIEIQGVENGDLAVPVNNTLVSHTAFLAADTPPCILIGTYVIGNAPFNGLESVLESKGKGKESFVQMIAYTYPTFLFLYLHTV